MTWRAVSISPYSPASADALAPPHMGKTRFFSQVRMACVTLRKHVEVIVAEATVAGANHGGATGSPPEALTLKLDAVFETAVDALTDQLYGAFQHAGSKHVMAARFREAGGSLRTTTPPR